MSQTSAGPAAAGTPAVADVSPQVVQSAIDEAAHFNLFSIPDPECPPEAITGPAGQIIGMCVCECLHRFQITVQAPSAREPLIARNIVGERIGRFTHRWLLAPDNWPAAPNCDPPPTPLDITRSQRFVMLDSVCRMGHGDDGFRGFGTGLTIPTGASGGSLRITAIGTILEGSGKFREHQQGTYLYCGALTPQNGFMGNVMMRLMDPQETLQIDGDLPSIDARGNPEPDVTYVVFRGQAVPADPVSPRIGSNGQPNGLTVVQGLRLLELDACAGGAGGVRSVARVGQTIGKITASVTFDPSAPGGSNLDPIPFLADDQFVFQASDGKPVAGGMHANSIEGRVFKVLVLGQQGIRFGGTGLILSGTGPFEGISGLMTDNSVVSFTPHVSASVYLLRIDDPQGRFRSAAGRNRGREAALHTETDL